MIVFNNANNIKEIHYQGHIIKEVHNEIGKVWPESIVSLKFYATYTDSTTYSAACDSDTALTSATTKAHTTSNTAMTTAEIGSCITSIGNRAFQYCTSLTSVTIPSSVTSIDNSAFDSCTSLTNIDIPSGVTSIGSSVFQGCTGLTSIVIPSTMTLIGGYAFNNCRNLTSITVKSTTPPTLGSSAFDSTNNCPIYVPPEAVETYKAASGWSTYASRIYAIGT